MLEGGNQGETDAVPSGHDLRGVAVLGDMREGTIFVRKVGKTEPATAADIDRLTERARRVGMSLTLDLHVLAPVKTLDPIFLSEEFREEQLGKRRAQLQASLPAPSSGLLASIDRLTPGENRTRDRFIAEIDRFVDDAEREWDTLVAVKELEHDPSKLRLELVNESDDNFSDVVLEVTLPLARAQVHLSGSEAEERLNPPAEPPSWGNGVLGRISVVRAATQGLTPAELVEQSETSTLVRFFPIQVRPRTRHAMPEVLLALPPFMAGQTLEAPWRATSSSTRGDKPDAVEIEIVLPDA